MRKIHFALLFLVLPPAYGLLAQSAGYRARNELILQNIRTRFSDSARGLFLETSDSVQKENPHAWLWPLCAYLQAANEMEWYDPAGGYMAPVETAVEKYYSDKPPAPAYQDYVTAERKSSRFYDDNQWIAITCLDAYNRTHRSEYLDKARMIARFMLTGLDTVAGGGLYWKEGDPDTKNTCSNGPGILVLLGLYQADNKPGYLDTALALYHWTNSHLQAPEGVYYDNINTKTGRIGKATFTYNTGTMLQANVVLYQITNDKQYLAEAQRIAAAARVRFFVNGRLPNGNYWFNAVMLRGYQALYAIDGNKAWVDFFRQDADAVWQTERDEHNQLGPKPSKRLIDQAAMMEIYARLEVIEKGPGPAGYHLAWSDEFNHTGKPDPGNWAAQTGFIRNEEDQWYQPGNARCENGLLVIEGRGEDKPNPSFAAGSKDWRKNRERIHYSSACLVSRGLHEWKYGRFEMRGRINTASGLWPAWWTLGTGGRWPGNGEIDIMEFYRKKLLANIACQGAEGKPEWFSRTRNTDSLGGAAWSSAFHVWRMDWDSSAIRLYVDDTIMNEVPLAALDNKDGTGINPFRQPHYMLLNLAMGGLNGGPLEGTAFPNRFEVDCVRVYQRDSTPAAGGGNR